MMNDAMGKMMKLLTADTLVLDGSRSLLDFDDGACEAFDACMDLLGGFPEAQAADLCTPNRFTRDYHDLLVLASRNGVVVHNPGVSFDGEDYGVPGELTPSELTRILIGRLLVSHAKFRVTEYLSKEDSIPLELGLL